jgi:hypothetical protein
VSRISSSRPRRSSSCGGVTFPYATVEKKPHVSPGDVVENKRLGAVLAMIQAAQTRRDEARLASPKMTVQKKDRLRARRQRFRERRAGLGGARKATTWQAAEGLPAYPHHARRC